LDWCSQLYVSLLQSGSAAIAGHSDFDAQLNHKSKRTMKIAISVSACCLLFAASLFASSLQEQNKAIAKRAFEEILSRGRFELAEELYARDFINHGIHRNASLEEDQAALKGWHQAFPDVVITAEKLIAEGDLVTVYWIARGTNTGAGNGLPATGKKAELAGITIWRIVDNKIKEEWSAFDQLSMMQQLGLLPPNK
jgi:steroid delta-isomerase-like uncharacterized protein